MNKFNNKICVVIPLYKQNLSNDEFLSYLQCNKILKTYDIYVVCPKNSNFQYINSNNKIIYLDSQYFQSIYSYNMLCTSYFFYLLFEKYDYMLIYQLDAFILSDKLVEWSKLNYDYIGSPWCHLCNHRCKYDESLKPLVGNGGFSMRKVSKFLEITKNILPESKIAEDWFFMTNFDFKVPTCIEARNFSIENCADIHVNNGIIPIGYHKIHPEYIRNKLKYD